MKLTCVSLICYILAIASIAESTPILDLFFGNTGGRNSYGRRPRTRHVSSEGGGYNDYKRICGVVNPNPYAFIGSNPYPGVPFCPP